MTAQNTTTVNMNAGRNLHLVNLKYATREQQKIINDYFSYGWVSGPTEALSGLLNQFVSPQKKLSREKIENITHETMRLITFLTQLYEKNLSLSVLILEEGGKGE